MLDFTDPLLAMVNLQRAKTPVSVAYMYKGSSCERIVPKVSPITDASKGSPTGVLAIVSFTQSGVKKEMQEGESTQFRALRDILLIAYRARLGRKRIV
jgi:hypothetical protein